jgi:hypothetical protein
VAVRLCGSVAVFLPLEVLSIEYTLYTLVETDVETKQLLDDIENHQYTLLHSALLYAPSYKLMNYYCVTLPPAQGPGAT